MDPARTSRDTWIGATILGPVGASIVASGLWGSPKCIKTLTLSADHHWASIFFWILAFPVHLVMTMFDRKR